MAVILDEDWEWSWVGEGRPDPRPSRGRVYYDRVRGVHAGEDLTRIYRVGDVIATNGDQAQCWSAQIIELFQVRGDDTELREILHIDSRRKTGSEHYELMRCTLRWFYNLADVPKDALRRSRIPKPIKHEIYFSDHVEKNGYNDVTDIEGLVFIVGGAVAKQEFLREPPKRFVEEFDHVRVVRCFINSNVDENDLRCLDKGELTFLLQNPCLDKDLYIKARQRMMGKGRSKDPVMKSLSKKRRRSDRPVINFDDDTFDPEERTLRRNKRELKLAQPPSDEDLDYKPQKRRDSSRKDRRSKRVITDDDEGSEDPPFEMSEDEIVPSSPLPLSDQQAQNLSAANDEVLDLVSELNAASAVLDKGNAFIKEEQATPIDVDQLEPRSASPFSSKRRKVQSKRRSHAKDIVQTIVIDTDGSGDEAPPQKRSLKTVSVELKERRATLAKERKSDKVRPSFMPTARKTAVRGVKARSPPASGPVVENTSRPHFSQASDYLSPAKVQQQKSKLGAEKQTRAPKGGDGLLHEKTAHTTEQMTKERNTSHNPDMPATEPVDRDEIKAGRVKHTAVKGSSKRMVSKDPTTQAVTRDPTQRIVSMDPTHHSADMMDVTGNDNPPSTLASAEDAIGNNGRAHPSTERLEPSTSGPPVSVPSKAPVKSIEKIAHRAETPGSRRLDAAKPVSNLVHMAPPEVGGPVVQKEHHLQTHKDVDKKPVEDDEEDGNDSSEDDEGDSEWWIGVKNVMAQLKVEFGKLPEESQRLLSDHIEFVFDRAVAKVVDRGYSPDMDLKDERIRALVLEVLDELGQRVIENGSSTNASSAVPIGDLRNESAGSRQDPMQV